MIYCARVVRQKSPLSGNSERGGMIFLVKVEEGADCPALQTKV